MNDFEKMSAKELNDLKADIDKELIKRKRKDYDKLLKNFINALDELASKFPNEVCLVDDNDTWYELYHDFDWSF